MNTRTRVTAIPALMAAGATMALPGAIFARQEATPAPSANPFADLGLPELTLGFTMEAISGMPESVEAGRYLLTINGDPPMEAWAFGAMFLRLPDGMTFEDAMAEAMANPNTQPPFYFDSHLAGGPTIMAGSGKTTAYGVIDLPPGDWFVAGGALMQPPIPFTVTGEMPQELPEPSSDVTITLGEMVIEITEGELKAGNNRVRIDNIGAQIHQIEVEKLPEDTTEETVLATFEWEKSGTPVADILEFENIEWVGFSMDQSGGTSMWMELELDPGRHGIFCFLPDAETGMPHAYMGMWTLIDVGE